MTNEENWLKKKIASYQIDKIGCLINTIENLVGVNQQYIRNPNSKAAEELFKDATNITRILLYRLGGENDKS